MIPKPCYDCLERQMQMTPMMPAGYIPANMQNQVPYGTMPFMMSTPQFGMPVINAGEPSMAPGGTTAAPPFPTPQAVAGAENFQQNFEMAPGSPVQQDVNYTQGYLRTQIGKRLLVSFLIGTNTYQDRTGVLESVGISYIILREPEGTRLLCDIYSIKFVRIFEQTTP
ncbi:hypothetical protein [Clostridium omnivorum]|uniref:Spore coat protein GerQ n=1 Tax=Clostridium omnivorum TaxID=1604902 RepID=A0ABQ5N0W5_9CLOT|nr:hypothetical protein [Clostridium sp. E14]GLC28844.1 hypothetical protein bsdE14_02540 [Clostridium sp. E14]